MLTRRGLLFNIFNHKGCGVGSANSKQGTYLKLDANSSIYGKDMKSNTIHYNFL